MVESAGVLLGFSAVTIIFLRLYSLPITEGLLGSRDAWQHLWNLWWTRTAILNLHTNPFYTRYLFYPSGAPLYYHALSPVNGVLSIPFQFMGGVIFAYNVAVLTGYVLGGYAAYLLTRRYTRPVPAFIAGLIFAFSPHHAVQTAAGHLDQVTHFWLPLYILAFLLAIEEQRWQAGIAAATLLALASLVTWYYAFALIVFSIVAVAHQLWQSWTRSGPARSTGYGQSRVERPSVFSTRTKGRRQFTTNVKPIALLSIAVLVGVTYALLVAPVLIPTLIEGRRAAYMIPPIQAAAEFSADLRAFVTPSVLHPWWGERMMLVQDHFSGKIADNVVFIGFVPLSLAGVAVATRRQTVGRWALVAIVFVVLAMGPWLHINGSIVRVFGRPVVLPYALLYRWVPFVRVIRTPSRLLSVLMLAIGILAALGLDGALAYLRRRGHRWQLQAGVSVLAGALILFEFWPRPLPTAVPPASPPFIRAVLQAGEPGAVLDIPQTNPHGAMYLQTLHQRPIAGGYLSRDLENPLESVAPLRQMLYLASGDQAGIVQASASPAEVAAVLGFRYVVFHKTWPLPDQAISLPGHIKALLGNVAPSYEDKDVIVYSLAEPAGPAAVAYLVERDGWYPRETDGKVVFRWFKSPAIIRIVASAPVWANLTLTVHTSIQPSTLEIYTEGGRRVGAYPVTPGRTIRTPPIPLQSGENIVRLIVPEGNLIPAEIDTDNSDFRQLAVAIRQIQLTAGVADSGAQGAAFFASRKPRYE
ncbi:MAG: hypothetical protein D6791_15255 [Chloroflexi bacterium]|nr:MAG: hypothetical protein D6791_15255 [Chloroflexota bacterium]